VNPFAVSDLSALRRYRGVWAMILAGLALTMAGVFQERQQLAGQFSNDLAMRAADHATRIQRSLDAAVEVLESTGGFFDSSTSVERDEFKVFVHGPLASHPEIRSLMWVPRVAGGERLPYETELAGLHSDLGITEHDTYGRPVPAKMRDEYFPVFYVEPATGNEFRLGFDMGASPVMAKALYRAATTAQISISGVFELVQGSERQQGIILFRPVYQHGAPQQSIEERRRNLRGFVVTVLSVKEVFSVSLQSFRPAGLDALLLASAKPGGGQEVLHFHPSRSRTAPIPPPGREEVTTGPYQKFPIRVPGGEWSLLFRPAPAFYQEHESPQPWVILVVGLLLTTMAAFGILKRIRYTEEILNLARHDALTGLPNRLLFQDRLEQALAHADRDNSELAVLFLDLDRFKHINDSLGHALGDELLQKVAARLRSALRREDTVARMGGDEFILLLPQVEDDQAPAKLAEKLLEVVAQPYQLRGRTFYLSASIGISLYPRDGAEVDVLVANADAAMYRAKENGRNTFEFYSHDLTAAATERWQIEVELRQALEQGKLQVYYQPEVDLASGDIIGAEALARWVHPEHGDIPPSRFIPVAEDSGLIVELGEYVLLQACRQTKSWLDRGLALHMAVNVSGRQIKRGDFVATVQRVLDETGLPPECLELEVAESFIMEQAGSSIETLITLSRLGVMLSIDDFGTGNSSLTYLKRLPIDKLKIDRSFIRDLPWDEEDVAITLAVIALARSLGLRTIAEGVETLGQRDFLQQAGCGLAQGFIFGYPVPPEDFPLERVRAAKA
jgi:diguanylate cyclase (GGDEF)-like protein